MNADHKAALEWATARVAVPWNNETANLAAAYLELTAQLEATAFGRDQFKMLIEAERKTREKAEFKATVTHENNVFLKEGMRQEHERASAAEAEVKRIEAVLHSTQDLLAAAERRWQRDMEIIKLAEQWRCISICRNLGADAAADAILALATEPAAAQASGLPEHFKDSANPASAAATPSQPKGYEHVPMGAVGATYPDMTGRNEALRLEGMEWCANECSDNEDAADDAGNRQAAKAHALDAEIIRAEIARRKSPTEGDGK
jgi:hypothetical protein